MNKSVLATALLITVSLNGFANANTTENQADSILTPAFVERINTIKLDRKIEDINERIAQRKNDNENLIRTIKKMKTAEDKYVYVANMNANPNGHFHVNDNIDLKLAESDQKFFDQMYIVALLQLKYEFTKSAKQDIPTLNSLVQSIEKRFPFRILPKDVNSIMSK